jgi:hypothetical protein
MKMLLFYYHLLINVRKVFTFFPSNSVSASSPILEAGSGVVGRSDDLASIKN